ncbi:hypothetical protein B0T25DRAFT_294623 [Lasiosphaeria hispida]|uniref:Uncharacterized protein n=1 Tax=Lasiosphaeria hispida TaxID=260671 RepID=A0AAJ0HD22_9PEZI|nr:hypothetical protein B0T25DRAFT_294623 [Lasiosphaeria hispida]
MKTHQHPLFLSLLSLLPLVRFYLLPQAISAPILGAFVSNITSTLRCPWLPNSNAAAWGCGQRGSRGSSVSGCRSRRSSARRPIENVGAMPPERPFPGLSPSVLGPLDCPQHVCLQHVFVVRRAFRGGSSVSWHQHIVTLAYWHVLAFAGWQLAAARVEALFPHRKKAKQRGSRKEMRDGLPQPGALQSPRKGVGGPCGAMVVFHQTTYDVVVQLHGAVISDVPALPEEGDLGTKSGPNSAKILLPSRVIASTTSVGTLGSNVSTAPRRHRSRFSHVVLLLPLNCYRYQLL